VVLYLSLIQHYINCLQFFIYNDFILVSLYHSRVFLYTALRINGQCRSDHSTADSLTFGWQAAKSATSYRFVGHSVSRSPNSNTTRLIGLTPGSHYTFTVWAVSDQGLTSNNITCTSSTGRPTRINFTFYMISSYHHFLCFLINSCLYWQCWLF